MNSKVPSAAATLYVLKRLVSLNQRCRNKPIDKGIKSHIRGRWVAGGIGWSNKALLFHTRDRGKGNFCCGHLISAL